MSLFYPTRMRDDITAITVQELRALGIRGLLLDVDNTLTCHGSQALSPEVQAWLARMSEAGIAMTIVSNGLPGRVAPFADKVGLRAIAFACKPFPLGFWRGAKRLGLPQKACAVVGDQVFTDVLGARIGGFVSFLLAPIEMEHGKPTMRLKRWMERGIRERFRRMQDAEQTGGGRQ